MSSARKFIQRIANRLGYEIRRRDLSVTAGIPLRVVSPRVPVPWRQIAGDVLAFFERVPLFYDDAVPPPLRIGGAWRETLISRRVQQSAAITHRDADALAALVARYIPFDAAGSSFRYLTSIYRRR
ncbi:MAG TPA: hypothetical protein VKX28_13515 [Xanthobacteraceae bacterium]|nr:hypothetical protein [Xanthobacteraceae bacterium]